MLSASTAEAAEASAAGNLDHQAATHETFTYNDRNELLTEAGSAKSSSCG